MTNINIRDHLGWWSLVEHYTLHNIQIYKWAFELSSNVSDLSLFIPVKFNDQEGGGKICHYSVCLCLLVVFQVSSASKEGEGGGVCHFSICSSVLTHSFFFFFCK